MPPKKGTIVLVPFPFTDLSGQKVRPALVISDAAEKEDVIVVFISSKIPKKISDFDIKINPDKENSLKIASLIKCAKIATLDTKTVLGELGSISKDQLRLVNEKLRTIFSL